MPSATFAEGEVGVFSTFRRTRFTFQSLHATIRDVRQGGGTLELRDYVKVVRKRWWVIALVALIAVASAYGFSKTQPTIWRSAIKLSIAPSRASDYGQALAIKQILRNYSLNLTTGIMAQRVI